MGTRRGLLVSIGGAVAVAVLASIAPAAADGSVDVPLSTDGISFTTTAAQAILDPLVTLVPGGTLGSVLWIKNPTDSPAAVRVSATGLSIPSGGFAEDVTVTTVTSTLGGTHSSTLAELADCEMLVPSQTLEGGATMRLDLSFEMSPRARNISQSQRADLSVLIAMRDADAGAFPASACDDVGVVVGPTPAAPTPAGPGLPNTGLPAGPSPAVPSVPASTGSAPGTLARTGEDLPLSLIAIGALLLGAGFFLIGARRHRDREES